MEKEKEKWINSIIDSTKGSARAKPSSDLFTKIKTQVYGKEVRVISLLQQRIAGAAAILLLVGNAYIMLQYQKGVKSEIITTDEFFSSNLISDYKLYD